MRKILLATGAVLFALTAVGCGSSGGSDSSETTTTTKATSASTTTEAVTTTADGGGTSDATEEEYTAAFVVNLSSGSKDDGNLVISEDEATCVAPKFVDAITVDVLQENGVDPAEVEEPGWDGSSLGLTETQGEALVDSFGACDVDIVALLAEGVTMGLTEEQQACAAENIDPDLAKALLVKTFSTGDSDAEFEALLADLTSTCDLPAN